ncbi:MAG: alpha-L-fucosidase [Verrucomicrobia bacterium]|nr:alpha-L-fucosidase [Verrucomicrobiota bacterium]
MKLHPIQASALLFGLSLMAAVAQTNPPIQLKLPPIADGPFKADWSSLTNYQTPEWFRDAKFGIWAHWGAQCEPEHGDWYARRMYENSVRGKPQPAYTHHLENYGHPSTNGFKDVIRRWNAASFNPDQLVAFYKENGAKYFMALANHHDNFDNWNSKYQPWNSVNVGPQKNLIGGWAAAAKKNNLPFGVSVHASRAWSWYEPAQGADKAGPLAGVPYDGKLTKADGKGQWWDGLDPQDLYAQNHKPGAKMDWDWDPAKGSSTPDAAYMEKFFLRTKQLWDDYKPDLIYFDDSVLPLHGVTDEIGLTLAAHFYNSSIQRHGRNEAVMNTKKLNEMQRQALVYDIERGKAGGILPQPWQTDTCLGSWHYDQDIFNRHGYKSAPEVIKLLADIVSKNGNLMLSVPLQRGGQPDADAIKIVSEIGAWLKVNGEAIYATRPWKMFGEGPSVKSDEKGHSGGQSDVQKKPLRAVEIRFTQSKDGNTLFAIVLEIPKDGKVTITSLAANSPNWPGKIGSVELVGGGKLEFTRDETGVHVALPGEFAGKTAFALKIRPLKDS